MGRPECRDPPLNTGTVARMVRFDGADEQAADAFLDPRQRVEKSEVPLPSGQAPRQHDDRPPVRYAPGVAERRDPLRANARRVEGG